MSAAGRRRSPVTATRVTASLAILTLVSAAVVPAALAPEAGPSRAEVVNPATGALYAAAPTDLIRLRQWHMNALRVPKAWKWSKGKEIVVAVLDTGVDAKHRDLTGQVITGPDYTGRTRKPGGKFWGGHGTAMASIIAGHGNGPGATAGIVGVAPQARILSIRVTWENDDPLRENTSQVNRNRDAVAKGIRYAVDHGADVINMSLGGGRPYYEGNSTEEAAIKYALSKGVVLIASAGNDGAAQNRKNFPAAYPGVIAVGALDRRLKVWKDTNRHSYVSACAPGVDIISAAPANRYVVGTGTSPSSAIVAGVAALVKARYPKLTPEEVRQSLLLGVSKRSTPNGAAGPKVCPGSLDAVRAIAAANRINKTAHGPGSERKPPATPAPAALPTSGDSNQLLIGILGGGGVLLLAGLVLGWRQRRRPEDEGVAEGAYTPVPPREPVAMLASPTPAGVEQTGYGESGSYGGQGANGPIAYGEHAAYGEQSANGTSAYDGQGTYGVEGEPDPYGRSDAYGGASYGEQGVNGAGAYGEPGAYEEPGAYSEPGAYDGGRGVQSWQDGDGGQDDDQTAPSLRPWQGADPMDAGKPPHQPGGGPGSGSETIWPPPPTATPPPTAAPVPLSAPVPPQPEPVNGHGNGNGHGDGNGHLDLGTLRPFDSAHDGATPTLSGNGGPNGGHNADEHNTRLPFNDFPLGIGADLPSADPVSTDPLRTDPLGSDPLRSDPRGVDPLGVDPLGDDPLPAGSTLPADTPLADESWRRIRQNMAEEPVTEDETPTSTFPMVENQQAEPVERPDDEDDYRPPWL